MKYTTIRLEQKERVATITLNRPDRRNALDDVMIRELTDAFLSANRETDTRIIVVTGEGKAFCAGMDLEYLRKFAGLGEHENLEDARNLLTLLRTVHTLRKPVIAMVNGPALGGGCGLASACDFVFASKEYGKMGVPEVKLGFLPAVILVFLIKRMGEASAREFVLSGGILTAEEALARGLCTQVVPAADLAGSVDRFAAELCVSTSASSISLTKDLFTRMTDMSLHEAMEYAAHLNALARKTEDFKKGLESFLRKEPRQW
jgi:methylglutaconyl-CoA hydratase